MRRTWIVTGGLAAAALVCVAVTNFSIAKNREEAKESSSKSPTAAQLPIGQVVLFSSGVGYFQREGAV